MIFGIWLANVNIVFVKLLALAAVGVGRSFFFGPNLIKNSSRYFTFLSEESPRKDGRQQNTDRVPTYGATNIYLVLSDASTCCFEYRSIRSQ